MFIAGEHTRLRPVSEVRILTQTKKKNLIITFHSFDGECEDVADHPQSLQTLLILDKQPVC